MSPEPPLAPNWPWSALRLEKMPAEPTDIRRAYARALKQIDQATDIEGFAALRHAYDAALAIREGRSQRNAQRRAVKAAKIAALTPTAEDIPPNPAPLPADTSVQDAQTAKDAAIQTLVAPLLSEESQDPACKRIFAVLENQLSHDPEAQMILRTACAQLLRKLRRPNEDGHFSLSPQITAELLLALDQRFGWLNDYAAYRRDFGKDTELQHLIVTRAYGNIQLPVSPVAEDPPQTGPDAGVVVIGGIILVKVIAVVASGGNSMTSADFINLAGFAVFLGGMYAAYKALRRRFMPVFAAILTCWFAAILPLLLFPPDFIDGTKDYGLAWLWLGLTNVALLILCFRPAATWLVRHFYAKNSNK